MTTKPFNDDPDHVPVKPFQPGVILGFINFYRRFIVGTLLLAGVAYLILCLNYSEIAGMFQAVSVTEARVATPESQAFEPLKSAVLLTTDEEINWLLDTNGEWAAKSPAAVAEMLQFRADKLKKLLEGRDLEPAQRTYCVHNYIDVVGLLSRVSGKTTNGVTGIDEMVAEVDELFGQTIDKDIAAKAKAIFVQHALAQFVDARSNNSFKAFSNALRDRQSAIKESELALVYVTNVFSEVVTKAGDDSRLRRILIRYLSNVIDQPELALVDLAKKVFFSEVDLDTLAIRLRDQPLSADSDMRFLLRQLKKHPDIPAPIYSKTVSFIGACIDNDQHEQAQRYLDQLREIARSITVEHIRDQVDKEIALLESLSS